ncbi:hypothetical protein FSARC_11310 [Fusarium sarcochroum]|uniref:Helicase n=1 Tax=Fusarium sarcochroum TaxID=1208366 RepID=A0A8H4TGK4_9HYPO|nr:hypothetical protein FSARC_11310 [Fusarium sarcochroum]
MDPKDSIKALQDWYSEQRPLTVDIVGDFAGRELFVIHGESLMRYCLAEAKVDFDGGFQLLHAIHAVEKVLSELKRRDCNFDVVFFRDLEDLCVPKEVVGSPKVAKYHLTRRVLIHHLTKSNLDFQILELDSFESEECKNYLSSHAVHFMLCDDGRDDDTEKAIRLQHLIWKVISSGRNAALINSIAWRSSKVFMPLLSGTEGVLPLLSIDAPTLEAKELPLLAKAVLLETTQSPLKDTNLPAREKYTVAFCRAYIDHCSSEDVIPEADLDRVEALLLQVAALSICSLQDRACVEIFMGDKALESQDHDFLHMFCTVTQGLLEMPSGLDEQTGWELFDIVDGRVFFHLLRLIRNKGEVSSGIIEYGQILRTEAIRGFDLDAGQPFVKLESLKDPHLSTTTAKDLTALPFSHPVLDGFLRDVKIAEAQETVDPAAEVVFKDLRHWHAYKPVTTSKPRDKVPVPPWVEKRRQKQMQWRMADVISYAASLTNSVGKAFNRETIVVNSHSKQKPNTSGTFNKAIQSKGPKQKPSKGGKQSALLAAQKLNDQKAQAKLNDILSLWHGKCGEFEKARSLIDRYLKALEFQSERSSGSHASVRPEIQLYLCHILTRIWGEVRERVHENSPEGLYLISMMWNWLRDISKSADCTPNVASAVNEILKALVATQFNIAIQVVQRKLPFTVRPEAIRDAPKLIQDHRLLQLEHGGPYMDRRFGSQPDPRVPFEPDAWQRDVLDSIDANESLLVVAPTSAGKTFISFYAMKKVLEESDDGVLVYVAPTKALVNQIAAEIEARFSKTYHKQNGKSIWAVHTRDYRINNPSQCQILVTVPHMLQIMLLAPTNAIGPNAWSRRVNRIIFDEVHCIGQAEDGVVWEQLLLLAPCPVIALSATVGNPNELKDWLAMSQKQKGYDMKMIVHEVRYSDLRKFTYEPPEKFAFKGLSKSLRLPVPGLDEGDGISPNFKFVHPVVALKDRNRAVLDDVNLEARDCLTLWTHMDKTFPPALLENTAQLNPAKTLPEVIEKSHVIEWERSLKSVLKRAMETCDSPLQDLQTSLDQKQADPNSSRSPHTIKLFALVCELHAQDALPALVFNYDRFECEQAVRHILSVLQNAENAFKETDLVWQQKIQTFEQWKKQKESGRQNQASSRSKSGDENVSKLELARDEASVDVSQWESFDPEAPLDQFSFAGTKAMQQNEFDKMVRSLSRDKVAPWLIDALRRGLGVHHAGMNRRYRQIVEMLFRQGYLRLVVATGTLALGINMPCKTVIFSGDSVFLSPQNYRQASGRAGRRGFDLLGNVVFNGISRGRVHEIMSSRLPALKGQFPISTTLILRLFVLLDGTKNCKFATDAVDALLSQTRLYLGGPEAEMSVKHHLRFSIEYLRRQNLLSANGAPVNFAGLVGHLYFTENAVFAFHSLLRGGYFHEVCKDIDNAPERVLRELMLVLSHLFNRIPIQQKSRLLQKADQSSSEIFLRRLPDAAEKLLIRHNQETLSIFKDYVQSYINQHLVGKPDRKLPLTKISVGPRESSGGSCIAGQPNVVRSPFSALSGFTDEFESIKELCSDVRGGIFLEESAIPYIPIWPHDTDAELNAYLYDFFKHGSLKVLVRDNCIKQGDVWFHLKDFHLTLKTIVTSLKGVMSAEGDYEMDDFDENESDMDDSEEALRETEVQKPVETIEKAVKLSAKGGSKVKIADSWDDSDESESESVDSSAAGTSEAPQSDFDGKGGLMLVLKAFKLLEEDFGDKFYKIGA